MSESIIQVSDEDYYSCDLTKRIPVRVVLVTINGDTGFGILESLTGNKDPIEQYIDSLSSSPSINDVTITFKSEEVYWTVVTHRLKKSSIHETILQNGCMSRFPIVIQEGVQQHTVISPSKSALRNLFRDLRAKFSFVRVRRTRPIRANPFITVLTKKQEEAIRRAFDSGYYNTPREVTLREVGRQIGISRVAMQERLRRAEKRLVAEFIETYPQTHV